MATVIYTKPNCPYCAAAKDDFTARGVAFDERDVKASKAIEDEALKWSDGQRQVPIIVTDGAATIGFNGH